jgi:pimeloyl-ACP methyl ester carboxylesterase
MFVTVEGQSVFVATGGKTFDAKHPTIVFIHGAGMDGTAWQLPARWFAHHGWSVLVPDLPGHGRSAGPARASVAAMVDFVEALLKAQGVTSAALVGHSMGGAIALETAARLGSRALGLGLIGTSATIPVGPGLLQSAKDAPEKAYRMMVEGIQGRRAKLGGSPAPGLWMTGLSHATFLRGPRDVLATDLAACNVWETGKTAAAKVACPTLVLSAADDVMTPAKRGVELAGLIAGAKSVVLKGVGHNIMAEAPDDLLDNLIAAFGKGDAINRAAVA